jgi:thiamine biosynthesis lipoprotein
VTPPAPGGAALSLGDGTAAVDAHRFGHEAMNTVFEVLCAHDDRGYARQAAQAGFELVDRLEQDLSRFIANSDISRINALGAGQGTRVSPWTMECLDIAWRMHALTGGVFDISIGSGLDRLELVADGFVVRAREEGARLDLGGIGKGYAVDRVAELLEEWEVPCALVHGGFSSVLALEPPPGRDGWPLGLTAPGSTGRRIRISARHLALSASGTEKGAHIQDPRDGQPVRDRAAWAALGRAGAGTPGAPGERTEAPRSPAAVVEALSTAFMILPVEAIAELCRANPGLEAWVAREGSGDHGAGSSLVHLGGPGEPPDENGG